jgi:hypothetical protein
MRANEKHYQCWAIYMSRMLIRSLQRQLDPIGDRKEQKHDEMQTYVCNKMIVSTPSSLHHVNHVIPIT